jgi:hypothetical protein
MKSRVIFVGVIDAKVPHLTGRSASLAGSARNFKERS